MDWEKEPRLAEFAKIFDSYVKDIMNVNDPDDDTMYEIVGLDLDYLGGCGCPSGITIRVKKIED